MKEVHTQEELDAAGSEWVFVTKGHFIATDSAHVEARGSVHVVARDFLYVVARDSAHVVATDSVHVVATDSAHVVATDSAHVVAWDSAHVVAWDSAHVVARGSAHVVARGSVHVVAWDSVHVEAWDFVTITKKSILVVLKIGNKVLVSEPNYPDNIKSWAELKGIRIKNSKIRLWKATQLDGTDFQTGQISYLNTAVAPDWDPNNKIECGNGLHLSDSPSGARFFIPPNKKFRLFLVEANIKECVCYPGTPSYPMKLRAKKCKFVKEYPSMYFESNES